MQLEIRVALNFFISFMYNKLPRRRVNIFGEELEKALRCKFQSHWYPDKPNRGSGYRCLRSGDPVDPVLDIAARESGLDLNEIRDNIPAELSVWIDPGEVSYRIGEKSPVKVIYSEQTGLNHELHSEEDFGNACGIGSSDGLLIPTMDIPFDRASSPTSGSFSTQASSGFTEDLSLAMASLLLDQQQPEDCPIYSPTRMESLSPIGSTTLPPSSLLHSQQQSLPSRFSHQQPLTFTTASFAQTKFGSTKLKNGGKRSSRMSPTEFSHYIKQRAIIQQQQQQQQHYHSLANAPFSVSSNFQDDTRHYPHEQVHQQPAFLAQNNYTLPQSQQHVISHKNGLQYHQKEPDLDMNMSVSFYDPLLGDSCSSQACETSASSKSANPRTSEQQPVSEFIQGSATQRHQLLVAN